MCVCLARPAIKSVVRINSRPREGEECAPTYRRSLDPGGTAVNMALEERGDDTDARSLRSPEQDNSEDNFNTIPVLIVVRPPSMIAR